MSIEIDSPELSKPEKHRKSGGERNQKKRKREQPQEVEPGSPAKKYRTDRRIVPLPSTAPTQPLGPTPSPATSPFYEQTSSLYLSIAPIAQNQPIRAICAEHLSPLLLTYYPPLHGVLISYSNPRLSSDPHADGRQKAYARSIDEYAASFIWVTADFLIFRPLQGDVIEGFINLQHENSIGIVYWNFFNASIERKHLPREWQWIPGGMSAKGQTGNQKLKKAAKGADESTDDAEQGSETGTPEPVEPETQDVEDNLGHFQDGNGKRVEDMLRFYVKDVETSRSADRENGFLGVEGMIILAGEEKNAT